MRILKPTFSFFLLMIWATTTFGQNAIGQWKDYLSYINSIDVEFLNTKVYVANENAIFIYNTVDNSIERLTKLNGLSGVGIVLVRADREHNLLFIGYEDGYIDVLQNGVIYPFAEIKNSAVTGDKSIRHISFDGNTAYISTGVGILEFDLEKREVRDTYGILPATTLSINETAILNDTLYAATEEGLYRGCVIDDLTIFSNWTLDLSTPAPFENVRNCAVQDGRLYINLSDFSEPGVYMRRPDQSWQHVYGSDNVFTVEPSLSGLVISAGYTSALMASNGTSIAVSISDYGAVSSKASALTTDASGTIWIADRDMGLVKWIAEDNYEFIVPDGPASNTVFDIDFYANQLWITTGQPERPGTWNNSFKIDGFYGLVDDKWHNYTWATYPILLDSLFFDSPTIYIDRADPSQIFVGSMFSGFLTVNDFDITGLHSAWNTSLGARPAYPRDDGKPYVAVSGFVRDSKNQLWVTNPYSTEPLSVRTESGNWKSFPLDGPNGLGVNKMLTSILIDDYNQKWAVVNRGGIVVFDEGTSLIDASDNKVRLMTAETGQGGLPVNEVECITEDLDGEIWVGTGDGVAVFYAPFDALTSNFSDARRILIQQNGVYQYLLQGQAVSSIAVDGANRKWIGTFGAGVFLQSEDGTEQIKRFTAENSPLLSNIINDIVIDHETGEVFFGTSEGVVSYISNATAGEITNNCTSVYPNPVRENYTGPIAISGLMRDSQVRITDTRGNLIFSTVSNGGKAIWNGENTNGQRVATGVYFALSVGKDGKSTCVSKILVIK